MDTLICIFADAIQKELEKIENEANNIKKGRPAKVLEAAWMPHFQPGQKQEIALFLSGIMHDGDQYPSVFRRFVQVGPDKNDRVRNVFELAFEKGYGHCLFVEDLLGFFETKVLAQLLSGLEISDMTLLPRPDGSLLAWGMNLDAFSVVHHFDTTRPEAVVDQIGLCMETGLRYQLLDSMEPEWALTEFRHQLLGL